MHNYFQAKVSYEKTLDEGCVAKVSESYLIDALSFTEAEARITEEMRPCITGEFEVSGIRRCRVAEVIESKRATADRWYRCKVMYITIDEEKGIEKRTPNIMYVYAERIVEALDLVISNMDKGLTDYVVASIVETDIMNYFPYTPDTTES